MNLKLIRKAISGKTVNPGLGLLMAFFMINHLHCRAQVDMKSLEGKHIFVLGKDPQTDILMRLTLDQ